jgi:hypothetical protein
MPNVYGFRSGRSLKNVNPQDIGSELERLRESNGTLTAEIVLEAATDPESPLHAGFEWDDSAAAHQHRLQQARRLIVSVRILNSPTTVLAPAFVSVRTPGRGREYIPLSQAMTDIDLRTRVLDEARQAIESLERRYRGFEEASDILGRLKQAVA